MNPPRCSMPATPNSWPTNSLPPATDSWCSSPTTLTWQPDVTTSSGSTTPKSPTAVQTASKNTWSTSANAIAVLSLEFLHPPRPDLGEVAGARDRLGGAFLAPQFLLVCAGRGHTNHRLRAGAHSAADSGHRRPAHRVAAGVSAGHPTDFQRT